MSLLYGDAKGYTFCGKRIVYFKRKDGIKRIPDQENFSSDFFLQPYTKKTEIETSTTVF